MNRFTYFCSQIMAPAGDIQQFATRAEWRQWLAAHYDTAKEVWFVFPSKSSGEKGISYNDAVEEALCFEWIDSTIKTLDKDHEIQHFSPRNPKSAYSQANKERLKEMLNQHKIHPAFEERIRQVVSVPFVFPADIMEALQKDEEAWRHYRQFPEGYKRIRIAYIEAARKRPKEFEKRLMHFLQVTGSGKLIPGFGGIAKYYK